MDKSEDKRGRGRPEGSVSKISKEARERAKAEGDLPHEFLLRVMRGEVIMKRVVDHETGEVTEAPEVYDFDKRVDAAKAAAPYFAPKISTVEVIHGVSDDQLDEFIARAAAEAGISLGDGGEGEEGEGSTGGTASAGGSRQRVKLLD